MTSTNQSKAPAHDAPISRQEARELAVAADWLGLADRVCVITGAGGGIGREAALEIVRLGARVAVMDVSGDGVEETASLAKDLGGEAIAITCNVADPLAVGAAEVSVRDTLGVRDVLVNNAGLTRHGPLADISLADWQFALDVNLTGAMLCAQAFGRGMRKKGKGAIVPTSSICGSNPRELGGSYSPSKSALIMLSCQLAAERAADGVRSNVVSPGLVRTPMTANVYSDESYVARRSEQVPLGRLADPPDIAGVIAFLASGDRAGYVTGQEIVVDGGLSQTVMRARPR